MTPLEQEAQARKYSSQLRASIISLSDGSYALFSADAKLLTIGNWQSLEPHYLARPIPQARTPPTTLDRDARTALLLEELTKGITS